MLSMTLIGQLGMDLSKQLYISVLVALDETIQVGKQSSTVYGENR